MTPHRTAGPWRCATNTTIEQVDPDGETVCKTISSFAREDAAFIVEACNAHDSLIAQRDALRDALRYIVEWNDTTWNAETARDKARAALAAIDGV